MITIDYLCDVITSDLTSIVISFMDVKMTMTKYVGIIVILIYSYKNDMKTL